MIVNISAVA